MSRGRELIDARKYWVAVENELLAVGVIYSMALWWNLDQIRAVNIMSWRMTRPVRNRRHKRVT